MNQAFGSCRVGKCSVFLLSSCPCHSLNFTSNDFTFESRADELVGTLQLDVELWQVLADVHHDSSLVCSFSCFTCLHSNTCWDKVMFFSGKFEWISFLRAEDTTPISSIRGLYFLSGFCSKAWFSSDHWRPSVARQTRPLRLYPVLQPESLKCPRLLWCPS